MSEQYPDDFLSIYGLLFFGVPNGGIKTEYWMPIVDRQPNRELITSLEPNAYYLRNLQDNFNRVFCFPDARITSVYETMQSATAKEEPTGEWRLTGRSDILVSRKSAIGHYSDRIHHTPISFNKNHSDLPKFMSRYDENYRAVEPFIIQCYNDACEVIQNRFVDEATRPEYNMNSAGRYRFTCGNCEEVYRSQLKLLKHLKGYGNDICYLKILHYAIINGQLSTASMLLTADKRIDTVDGITGNALLHDAVHHEQADAVKLLLNRGANIEVKNNKGNTPLHEAVHYQRADLVTLLLNRGADIEATNDIFNTPLFIAIGHENGAIVRLLLDRGARLATWNENGDTPIHDAARTGNVDIVKILLDRGADIEVENGRLLTPLSCASQKGKADVVKLLLDRGAESQT